MKRTLATAAILFATASMLSACGGATPGDPSASPSTSATASVTASADSSPSPSPSPSATLDPHPPLAELELTTSGLLPLTLGVAPASNPGAAMIEWIPDYCSFVEVDEATGDLGRWQPTYPDRPFSVGATDTEVYRLDVWDTAIATPEGIRIGSTLAELQAAYPGLSSGAAGPTSTVWWIQDANGTVVFETQSPTWDTGGASAPTDPVILMRALSTSWGSDVSWPAANSGNIADACF
jgi:hypothetical protein